LNLAGAGLATANHIAPFHLLIYFKRLHSFPARTYTINRTCDRSKGLEGLRWNALGEVNMDKTVVSKRRIYTMKLRPLQDRILVQRVKEEDKTKGGIIIPDTAKEKPIEGKVIAAGNGKLSEEGKRIALEVKKGDRILFGKYSGTEIKIESEEYLIMREDDVLGIIE
jgi:chaperonin GroES